MTLNLKVSSSNLRAERACSGSGSATRNAGLGKGQGPAPIVKQPARFNECPRFYADGPAVQGASVFKLHPRVLQMQCGRYRNVPVLASITQDARDEFIRVTGVLAKRGLDLGASAHWTYLRLFWAALFHGPE